MVSLQESRKRSGCHGPQRVEFGDAVAGLLVLVQPVGERWAVTGFAIKADAELELRLRLQGCVDSEFLGVPAGVEVGHDLVRVARGVGQAAGVKQAVEVL